LRSEERGVELFYVVGIGVDDVLLGTVLAEVREFRILCLELVDERCSYLFLCVYVQYHVDVSYAV